MDNRSHTWLMIAAIGIGVAVALLLGACSSNENNLTSMPSGTSAVEQAAARTILQTITGTPPNIPHSIKLRYECLLCHGEAGETEVPYPANHSGQAQDSCQGCHSPAPQEPPAIPHALEGRDDCLICHAESSVRPFPADHLGTENDKCTGCHISG